MLCTSDGIDGSIYHITPKKLKQKVSQRFFILLDKVNDKSPKIQDGRN